MPARRPIALQVRKLLSTGFFHIVGAGTLNKVLTFAMSMVLVRVLSKQDYGCYAYAFNIASFFIMFNGLGMTSAIVQVCSELFDDKRRCDAIYAYCRRCGIASDVAIGAVIAVVALAVPLTVEGSNAILLLYCAFPLLSLLCELRLSYLRVRLENKRYALMTNVQTALSVVGGIGGAVLCGMEGLVVGQSLSLAASWAVMAIVSPENLDGRASQVDTGQKRDVWGLSLVSSLNNALSQTLTLVGTFLVGIYIVDPAKVASFKVATAIPFALLFIPGMVVTYVYPYFARNKDDRAWTLRNYKRLIGASAAAMAALSAALLVAAEPIVTLVFGAQYADAVSAFRVMLVGFFATAAFRQPTGNLLVTQRKLWFNTLVGVTSILFSVAVSALLVPKLGMEGAAVAYSGTMALGALMSAPYYVHVVRRIPS